MLQAGLDPISRPWDPGEEAGSWPWIQPMLQEEELEKEAEDSARLVGTDRR